MYYKVVGPDENGELYSAIINSPKYTVKYKIGEKVEGVNGTPLFAFSNKEDAELYCWEDRQVWLCDGESVDLPEEIASISDCDGSTMDLLIDLFWSSKLGNTYLISPPSGTVGLRSITLIKRVL